MKRKPRISDVMTTDPETVHTALPISAVYDLFRDRNYHHLPVLEGRKPIGIISATDILKLVYDIEQADDRMLRIYLDHQFNIEDAMTTDVETVTADAKLRDVVDLLSPGAIHSVLVVDDDGDLEGIVTSTDLIQLLGELL